MTDIIAATPYGRADGSSRVRVYEWLDRLGLPAEVLVAMPEGRPTTLTGWAAMGGRAIDAARHRSTMGDRTFWLHREVSPLSPGALEASLMRKARVALFDLDDALYEEPVRSVRSWLLRRRAKAEQCARQADVVIAGNERIADWASSLGASSVVVPSCVDPAAYVRKDHHDIGATARIVWVGSSGTLSHLRLVLPALAQVRTKRDLELVVIGPPLGGPPPGADGSPWPSWVRVVPWSEGAVHRELARMDVGVMPLPDLPYERGKCAYKLLQYGAAGLPVVGSPVGVNASILAAMGAPAPATHAGWVDALDGILGASTAERRLLGRRAAEVVADGYTFERWRPVMSSLLRGDLPG